MQALQLGDRARVLTIPPYLTALYSIITDPNVEVAGLIPSIVVEEMLHMALVANIFIAIGGSRTSAIPNSFLNIPGLCREDYVPG